MTQGKNPFSGLGTTEFNCCLTCPDVLVYSPFITLQLRMLVNSLLVEMARGYLVRLEKSRSL